MLLLVVTRAATVIAFGGVGFETTCNVLRAGTTGVSEPGRLNVRVVVEQATASANTAGTTATVDHDLRSGGRRAASAAWSSVLLLIEHDARVSCSSLKCICVSQEIQHGAVASGRGWEQGAAACKEKKG